MAFRGQRAAGNPVQTEEGRGQVRATPEPSASRIELSFSSRDNRRREGRKDVGASRTGAHRSA